MLLSIAAGRSYAADQQQPTEVAFAQLVGHPADYDQKVIKVRGFLLLEFENHALYSSGKWRYGKDAVWINFAPGVLNEGEKLNRQTVLVVGTFDAKDHGHMNGFRGTLIVKSCEVLSENSKSARAGAH